MSDELLNKIFDKLVSMDKRIISIENKVDRIENKLDSTLEQVVRNSESQTEIKQEIHTHAHHFNVLDKQLMNHAIEIEKLKNR